MKIKSSLQGGLSFTPLSIGTIEPAPLPESVVIAVDNHATLSVSTGDTVLTGQPLTYPDDAIVSSHASLSGIVTDISEHTVTIESDGRDTRYNYPPITTSTNYESLFRSMGLVGLGGAAFPVDKKLQAATTNHPIETLLINAAECDPAIYCDEALMQERAAEIVKGILLAQTVTAAKQCIIGIEENKTRAIAQLKKHLSASTSTNTSIIEVPALYPSGAETTLFKLCTGKTGSLKDNNAVCFNVATCYSMYQADDNAQPLICRIVSVVQNNSVRNFEFRIGTAITHIESFTNLVIPQHVICGGRMMGCQVARNHRIDKKTNSLLLDAEKTPEALPCIRCGACADVCPEDLYPQQLFWHTEPHNTPALTELNIERCIDCACCDAVCPSYIPLAGCFIHAKDIIHRETIEHEKAELAKFRYEKRLKRLQAQTTRQRQELDQKSAELAKTANTDNAKKALIAKALKRSKSKKAADQSSQDSAK